MPRPCPSSAVQLNAGVRRALLALLLPALLAGVGRAAPTPALPADLASLLGARFPSWKIAPVPSEVTDWFTNRFPGQVPWLASGDFDCDGQVDWVVLLQRISPPQDRIVVVFFHRPTGFEPVFAGRAADFIMVMRRGERDYDYLTGEDFTYAADSIFTGDFEKSGWSLVYRHGRFQILYTSD